MKPPDRDLSILQIGELVGKLSETFRARNPAIP